jgi:ABC-2 type transport system permease protein
MPGSGGPRAVVAAVTARRAARAAWVWSAVFAVFVVASAFGYAAAYRTTGQRHALAASLGANVGVDAILGPARGIDTVAGFTTWRSLGVLSVVGAVWGLLLGTRLLRGEEEAGRWELLLAGRTTRRRATAQALAGLSAGLFVLWVLPATVTVLAARSARVGFSAGGSLFLAVATVSGAAMFLVVGAFTGQLAPTRRQAAAWGAGALGLAYALRMVADSGTGVAWLRWATPLGWVEELRPLTGSRPLALVPIGALIVLLGTATVYLAGARDLEASTIPGRASSRPRTRWLTGPGRLTVRLVRPSLLGWLAGITAGSLVLGVVAKSAGAALSSSASSRNLFARLGAHGAGAQAYLGVAFLVLALLVALVAASQLSAARAEEASGRLEHLLVRPVSRQAWLLGRVATTVAALMVAGLAAALAAWAGAASQHGGVGVVSLLEAGANVLAPAAVVLGVGVLTLGLLPRAVSGAAHGLLAWSFLVQIVGSVVNADHWLLDTSLFRHMAAAPAVRPDWAADAIMFGIAAVATLLGTVCFSRRDLVGE